MTVHPDERAPVSRGWVSRFGLLYLGQNAAWAGPTQLLIAIQVADWFPGEKEERLAWLMAAGGAVMLVATPLAGAVSDRTTSRFGRRAPWILVGAVLAALALVGMGFATGYAALVAGWLVFQAAIAFSINAAQAVAPDQVPRRQYGRVSGVMGLTYTLGVVVGTVIGTLLGVRTAYLVTALVLLLLVGQFLVRFHDPQVLREKVVVERSTLMPSPRTHPDYAWVFLTRLLVTMGNSIALFYLLYFLRDRIRVADPEGGVLVLTVVYALMVIVSAIVSGRWSDRIDRRLVFVSASSIGVALSCVIMAWALDWWVVVVAAGVLGVSWGVYMAVDQALINEVLPTAADRGRDVGIMNIAVALPNTFSPVIAALALRNLGGYPGLYLLAAGLALLGGILVWRVRDVR